MNAWPDRRWIGRLLSLAIVAAALAVGFYVTWIGYSEPRTDDAMVRANLVGIAPHVSGPLLELKVVDNQRVREGDLLFVVDPRPFQLELERAQAARQLAASEVEAINAAIASARAEVHRTEVEAGFAGGHARRLSNLLAGQFVTRDKYEEALTHQRSSAAAHQKAKDELTRQERLLAEANDVNARLQLADNAVRQAQLNLDYCHVRAPFDGLVNNLNFSVGEYARAGQPVFTLVDARDWYVMANFQETYLESIRPGMQAEVSLLSYPKRRFRGTVEGVGWAIYEGDGAMVQGLPRVQPTLNWVRLAQRIPVRIRLDAADAEHPFRMGMSAVVTITAAAEPDSR